MTEAEVRGDIVRLYRELDRLGMNTGSTGNVSIRFDRGMIITPSGVSAATIAAERLVAVGLTSDPSPHLVPQAAGKAGVVPSSEWAMHARIYQTCPDARCIVHTHADAATALACLGEALPAFHYMIAGFGGAEVRCAPYVTFGTPALAEKAAEAISGRRACLLANHGMIVHGDSADHALLLARQLETLARQYLLARAAGTVRLLTEAEMQAAIVRFRSYTAGRG